MEEWKIYKEIIKGNIHYHKGDVVEVSNLGRVRINGELKDLSSQKSRKYLVAGGCYIHRMVAELFVPNPENKPYVDHINVDGHDNRADNLRWVTHKENCNNPITRQHHSDANYKRWQKKKGGN